MSRRARSTLVVVLVALGAVVVAAQLGWRTGGQLSAAPSDQPPLQRVRVGQADLRVSSSWTRTDLDSTILADVDSRRAQAFALTGVADSLGVPDYVVVAVSAPDDASLVSAPLREALAGTMPRPMSTVVGTRRAWRYSGLETRDQDRLMDVVVVPTTSDVLTVACVANRERVDVCRPDDVELITLRTGRALRPSGDLAFRFRLPAEVERLRTARDAATKQLDAADSRDEQASAVRALAAAYETTAARIAPLVAAQDAAAAVVGSLRQVAEAFGDAGRAADADAESRYRAAVSRVARAEAALEGALARIVPVPQA